MNNNRSQKGISPFQRVILYELLVILVCILSGCIVKLLKLPSLSEDLISNSILTILAVWLLFKSNRLKESGFRRPIKLSQLLYFLLPALLILLNLQGISGNAGMVGQSRILLFLAIAILTGFAQEAFFRGLILEALLSKGVWMAVLVSSLLFGLTHLVNIFSGADLKYTLIQAIYATCVFGFAGATLMIKTGTIIPLIVIHSIIDFLSFLKNDATVHAREISGSDVFIIFILSGIFIFYSVILLIRSNRLKVKVIEI